MLSNQVNTYSVFLSSCDWQMLQQPEGLTITSQVFHLWSPSPLETIAETTTVMVPSETIGCSSCFGARLWCQVDSTNEESLILYDSIIDSFYHSLATNCVPSVHNSQLFPSIFWSSCFELLIPTNYIYSNHYQLLIVNSLHNSISISAFCALILHLASSLSGKHPRPEPRRTHSFNGDLV